MTGGANMKICVSASGKDIDSQVDTAFGRAPYFLIIDTESGCWEVVENSAASANQGAGIGAVQIVADKGVDGVLTGYVGPNASNALNASGIKIFEGVTEHITVGEAIKRFKADEYQTTSSPSMGPGGGRGRGMGKGRGRGQRWRS
jgi:predicted Fe-Mo cluster-binding NifX family protein